MQVATFLAIFFVCSAGLVDRVLAWYAEDKQIKTCKNQLFF
jgi:hypothetical protein